MIHILADSCSDLSPDLRTRFNVDTIPLYITLDFKTYRDGELTSQELFAFAKETGKLPKTAAPSVLDFDRFFNEHPGEIVFVSIGSKISATYQSARLATEQMPDRKIHLVDTDNLSTGIGLLALLAADLRDQGCEGNEIAAQLEAEKGKVRTSFIVDTLDYLYMGGRCSALQNIMGSLLQIRPIIEIKPTGTLGIKEKTRGSRKKSLTLMLEDIKARADQMDPRRAFITHTGCDEDAEWVKSEILGATPVKDVFITYAGATVSSHCGPDTLGIIYKVK